MIVHLSPPPNTHTHTTHTNDMRSSVHIRIEPVHRLFLPRTMTKGMERAATKAAAASTYCTFVQFKKHLSLSLPLSLSLCACSADPCRNKIINLVLVALPAHL